jgi:hypothetical protein
VVEGRVGSPRSENRTPDGFSNGLLGCDFEGSIGGGAGFVALVDCVGEGGV